MEVGFAGKTLEQLGVSQSSNISYVLADVYGKILDRWDGTALHSRVFELEDSLFFLNNGQKYRKTPCPVCSGTSKVTKVCDRCSGQGKVRCVNCADGSKVDAFGRRKRCSYCDGTAHVTCEMCRDRDTNFILQGPNPKGLGKVSAKCDSCRDGMLTIRID